MAPNLTASQHVIIRDMILSRSLKTTDMAKVAGCSDRAIKRIRSNLRCFGATRAPAKSGGRPRSITPPMVDALYEYLLEKPTLYLDEMMLFCGTNSISM